MAFLNFISMPTSVFPTTSLASGYDFFSCSRDSKLVGLHETDAGVRCMPLFWCSISQFLRPKEVKLRYTVRCDLGGLEGGPKGAITSGTILGPQHCPPIENRFDVIRGRPQPHLYQAARGPGKESSGAMRLRSSGGKMGSPVGVFSAVLPYMASLSSLEVPCAAPAEQSQGRPVLGQT